MSKGITLDERLYRFGTMCVRGGCCTIGYKDTEFDSICPIYKKYQFFTYSLAGMVQIGRALYEGRLEVNKSVSDVVYTCMNCGACGEMCAEVDFPDIMQLQHELSARCVEAEQVPYEHMAAIEGLKKEDNMLGQPKADRGKWSEGLDVKDITKESAEIYFHAGCRISFDEELWPIARSAVNLLRKAGVDLGIAGKEEVCCGGRAYEIGYQDEFIKYAEKNIELLKTAGIKTLITACADGYYAFKVLYDMVGKGSDVEVYHITEYLDDLIKKGKLKLTSKVPMKVTYHDPCNLGRKIEHWLLQKDEVKPGEVYQSPRDILKSIPGLELIEMRRNRENAWCCGAGGGVIDAHPDLAVWTAMERINEAKSTGAKAMITACPWCKRNFIDAMKQSKTRLKIYDIVELVEKAL